MTHGERFALEGLLCHLKPKLSIEIGTADGGSLRRIAAHSDEVHSFDISPEVARLEAEIERAHVHIGDSTTTLPTMLGQFASEGRHVDFALVDGDHTSEGVQRDAAAILASDACRHTVVVFHDSANDDVRAGLEALRLHDHPKVIWSMLDFVPGYLCVRDHPTYPHAAWNGLALVLLGDREPGQPAVTMSDRYSVASVYQAARREYDSAGR
jgi:cephalosporin hydroxylase